MIDLLVILMLPFFIFSVIFVLQALLSPEGYEDKKGFHRVRREKKANPTLAYSKIHQPAPSIERNPSKPRMS